MAERERRITPPYGGVFLARTQVMERRRRPGPVAHGPRDHRAQPRARRGGHHRPADRRGVASPGCWSTTSTRSSRSTCPSAPSTSPSTATTSACGRCCPRRPPTSRSTWPARSWSWSTTCCSPAAPSERRSTPCPTSAGPGPCSWPSWSTGATGSCRSAPTTWARTCPPAATRWSTCGPRGRRAGGDAQVKHLLDIADLGADGIDEVLRPDRQLRGGQRPGHPQGAGPAGQDRGVALLRGLDPHPA